MVIFRNGPNCKSGVNEQLVLTCMFVLDSCIVGAVTQR